VHPFFIGYLALALQKSGHIMTAALAIAFYCATLFLSVAAAALFRKLGDTIPTVNALTIGVYKRTTR
jgi:hypothetical protein